MIKRIEWLLCPFCGNKTRIKLREDTVVQKLPLYCPKCKRECIIDVKKFQITIVEEAESRYHN